MEEMESSFFCLGVKVGENRMRMRERFVTTQGKVLATSALYLKRTSHN